MAGTTTNYKLNKPLKNEYVNVDVLNQNMDNIDFQLKSINNAISNLSISKIDKTTVATLPTLGLVKSGTDITVDGSGNVSVNDNSHKHTVSNISDLTATASELNYTKGVTSSIQTQLNTKAPLENPSFTGIPKAPTASIDTNTTQVATTEFTQTVISNHNVSSLAHTDIRDLIFDLTTRLNVLADSDDATLDQLSEIVTYIKSNRTLIENVTTNKVNVSDIIDNLTSIATNKPLSANQGKVLKDLIDALITSFNEHVNNKSNPHNVTKSQIGLGNVENKSSATIRNELTKENVTSALGYTPPASDTTYGVVSKTANGLTPQLPNETTTTKYLRQDGTWTVPPLIQHIQMHLLDKVTELVRLLKQLPQKL